MYPSSLFLKMGYRSTFSLYSYLDIENQVTWRDILKMAPYKQRVQLYESEI